MTSYDLFDETKTIIYYLRNKIIGNNPVNKFLSKQIKYNSLNYHFHSFNNGDIK